MLYFLIIFLYYYSIAKYLRVYPKMAKTKVCPHTTPLSSSPSLSPSPSPTLPPPPPLLHVTTPTHKTVPSAPPPLIPPPPQIVVEPPRKKIVYLGPFIKGQVGMVFFSLDRVRSYMEIPNGYLIIIMNFRLCHKYELVDSQYVLMDYIGNKWAAPEVFQQWQRCVENRELQDIDLTKNRLAIMRYGNTFKLCTSDKKSKYQTQTHFIPAEELANEDPCEKKDPDYIPPDNDKLD